MDTEINTDNLSPTHHHSMKLLSMPNCVRVLATSNRPLKTDPFEFILSVFIHCIPAREAFYRCYCVGCNLHNNFFMRLSFASAIPEYFPC